jgi:formyl-CoA transferase
VLDEAGVPAGPIYTAADIAEDKQYLARDMVQMLPVDVAGETRLVMFPGVVPLLGRRSLPVARVGPDLGEDTHRVLHELLGRACTCDACGETGRVAEG